MVGHFDLITFLLNPVSILVVLLAFSLVASVLVVTFGSSVKVFGYSLARRKASDLFLVTKVVASDHFGLSLFLVTAALMVVFESLAEAFGYSLARKKVPHLDVVTKTTVPALAWTFVVG